MSKRKIGSRLKIKVSSKSNGRCWYCGIGFKQYALNHEEPHVEHQLPRSAGGTDDLLNLVISCCSCNSTKGIKDLEGYRKYKLLKDKSFPGIFYGEAL